jgi:hypothetical protein
MNERTELIHIADTFHGNDRAYLLKVARDGSDEQVTGAIYEAEAKKEGRK